jgi:hypothetical protein
VSRGKDIDAGALDVKYNIAQSFAFSTVWNATMMNRFPCAWQTTRVPKRLLSQGRNAGHQRFK